MTNEELDALIVRLRHEQDDPPYCQEAADAIIALRAERDELRAAIFGSGDYCKTLRNGNFVEMAQATEAGRKGAIARAEAAEAKYPPNWKASHQYWREQAEKADARALAAESAALNGPITDLSEADHAAIVAHLSPECEPQSPLPNRNSLMMEVVRLRNAVAAAEAAALERAQHKIDVISGEQYRIVNAGNTAWYEFDAALRAIAEGE